MKRDAEQSAGIESGVSKKEKIGNYMPREQNEKNGKPRSPATESAPGGHKIK
jgi:hypothetical protein